MKLIDLPKHHALLIVNRERDLLAAALEKELLEDSHQHRVFIKTVLDIDTAREIISFANTPYNSNKTVLISFHTATLPAQNAMLKVLEEPKEKVSFIVVTGNKEGLLPTVLSRLHEIKNEGSRTEDNEMAEKFFSTKPTDRMKLKEVVNVLNEEDEMGRKNRESLKKFISTLVKFSKSNNLESEKLKKLLEMENYASDPSAPGKMILEYLSLLLPKVN